MSSINKSIYLFIINIKTELWKFIQINIDESSGWMKNSICYEMIRFFFICRFFLKRIEVMRNGVCCYTNYKIIPINKKVLRLPNRQKHKTQLWYGFYCSSALFPQKTKKFIQMCIYFGKRFETILHTGKKILFVLVHTNTSL